VVVSRVISDNDLLSWEVFSSGGNFGLPDRPKIIFHCLSDPDRRSRYIRHEGDSATAERSVQTLPDDALQQLLRESIDLD
jgi:hypothetical protein